MTQTTKEIFEKYQIRKTKKQKTAFIDYLKQTAEAKGYGVKVEKGYFGARNIVVGDPDKAKILYTAHYDTCPRLPFPNFITPKSILIYLLYQVAVVIALFAVIFGAGFVVGMIFGLACNAFFPAFAESEQFSFVLFVMEEAIFILTFILLLFGPANKHTANDNTSGVTALVDIMNELPENQREKAAFVFFDLEESGLFGSAGFASAHKKELRNKLVLNFDCVSDGNNILFAVKKGAKDFAPLLEESFKSDESITVEVATKGFFYPSDNMNFPCGVGVAALKKSKKRGVLYMDRIHTKKDTVYCEENIEFIKNGSIKLLENI